MLNDRQKRKNHASRKISSNYMRYDDVFMTSKEKNAPKYDDRFDDAETEEEYEENDDLTAEDENLFARDNILNSKMVQYQRRKLPALQRYNATAKRRPPYEEQYWEDDDEYYARKHSKYERENFFKAIWQKFVVALTSILSLVCLAWIAYNWSSQSPHKNSDQITVVEPQNRNFRVIPDNAGGIVIPNQDLNIYREQNAEQPQQQNNIIEPQTTYERPPDMLQAEDELQINVPKHLIHYINLETDINKNTLAAKLEIVRNRFANLLNGAQISINAVNGKDGMRTYAILVGPYSNKQDAIAVAKSLRIECSVISTEQQQSN